MATKTNADYQRELADKEANRAQNNQIVSGTSSALSAINPAFGLIGAGYMGASSWIHGGDAERQQALLQERGENGDYGIQQLRNNYYDTANALGGQIYGGGFGNYGSFSPFQQGQSPFQQQMNPQIQQQGWGGQPQNQQSSQGRGGNSIKDQVAFMNANGLSPEDMNRLNSSTDAMMNRDRGDGRQFGNMPQQPQINSPYQNQGRMERDSGRQFNQGGFVPQTAEQQIDAQREQGQRTGHYTGLIISEADQRAHYDRQQPGYVSPQDQQGRAMFGDQYIGGNPMDGFNQLQQMNSQQNAFQNGRQPQQQGLSSQQGQQLQDAYYNNALSSRPTSSSSQYGYDPKGNMYSEQGTPEQAQFDMIQQGFGGQAPRPGDGKDYTQLLQSLGQNGQGQGNQSWGGGMGGMSQQGLLDRFNQASQVTYNPQIDQLVGQQGQGIQNNQPLNMANLQQLQGQLGGINQNSQQGLQQLIRQSQGNNQNIQALYGQQSQNQLNGNDPQAQAYANLLGMGQNFANGSQDTSGFNQFSGAVGGALQNNQGQLGGIDQQTQQLIDANTASSQFEQDKAMQELNDQLSARGLSNSQAGTEALAGAQAQFARQRATDQAKIRQDAMNTGFNQRQQALSQQGNLAGQGANILSQQGQLGNADLNARIRALDTSGNLAGGSGVNQSRGIGDLINLLNANQSGIGNVNALQNQANQQNAGYAQANYGMNQQGINMGNDSLAQLMALYGQNEQRNQAIGQQGFQNAGAMYNAGNNLVSNGIAGANQQFMQNQQLNATQGLQNQQIRQANQAGYGQLAGAGLGLANEFYQGYQQNNPNINYTNQQMYPQNYAPQQTNNSGLTSASFFNPQYLNQ